MTNEECSGVLLWTDDLKAKLAQAESERDLAVKALELAEKLSISNDECVLCDSDFGADFGINGQLSHQRHCPFAALTSLPEAKERDTNRTTELESALRRYGRHLDTCRFEYEPSASESECDCGFSAALGATEQESGK